MKNYTLLSQKVMLAITVLAYIILSSVFGYAYRYEINPDGLSYLLLAGHIAEGNFQASVSGTWSPMFTWLIAPFLYAGFDGLTAARVVISLCGLGLLIISWRFTVRFDLSQNIKFIACLILALLISYWSIRNIGPDLLIAAIIICYFHVVTSPDILHNRKTAFYCGIIGGIAYLAKHYSLPFFLVNFPLLLLLKGYFERDKEKSLLKQLLPSLSAGMIGLLLVSSIWIVALSVKFERLTVTPAGKLVHAMVGPTDIDRRPPSFYGGLHKPESNLSLHTWEDPSEISDKYKSWSPFESKKYFLYQLKLIRDNCMYIIDHFILNSPFFTYSFMLGLLILAVLVLFLTPMTNENKYLYLWTIITFATYCSGNIITFARSTKFFYPLMVIFLFLSFHFIEEAIDGLDRRNKRYFTGWKKNLVVFMLFAVAVSAFSIKSARNVLKSISIIITNEQINPYKEIAQQVASVEFPEPYAIVRSSQKPYTDLYIAYYLSKQLLGRPLSSGVDGITKELMEAGAKSLVVFDNLGIVEDLKKDTRYIHLASIKLKKDTRYSNAPSVKRDEVTAWDEVVNIFTVKHE
jgi:hypothetical protein